jgi:hypothetical protein
MAQILVLMAQNGEVLLGLPMANKKNILIAKP